jgi:hypothetical protein
MKLPCEFIYVFKARYLLLLCNKQDGNSLIEIHLDVSVVQPQIITTETGKICLVLAPTMPVTDALTECGKQLTQETRNQFLSLFSTRTTPREFELANGVLIIRQPQSF